MDGVVAAVSRSAAHTMVKKNEPLIRLLVELGVEGDAHCGATVKHRSRVARDPAQPNLRQVHLMHEELHDELRAAGFSVESGALGENVTTRGVDLLGLPRGRCCTSVTRRSWRSPASAIPARSSTGSSWG